MAYSKKQSFEADEIRAAEIAKALSHPARVAILKFLVEQKSCICGDIVEQLPLSQSTVSQHLRELKNAGLIKGSIDGTSVCYCLDENGWNEMQSMLGEFLVTMKKCC